jgi:hypothetical protein
VKRSMNRAPGKSDTWWAKHQAECGGTYTKIQEPAPTKKQLEAMSTKERAGRQKNKLDTWMTAGTKKGAKAEGDTSARPIDLNVEGKTSKATKSVMKDVVGSVSPSTTVQVGEKRPREEDEADLVVQKKVLVECPICNLRIAEAGINEHLDVVHA